MPNARKLGVAASAKAAAALIGVPRRTVLAARAHGGPGFRQNGRIDCDVLKPWLMRQADVLAEGREMTILDRESVRMLALKNDKLEAEITVLRAEHVPVGMVKQWVEEFRGDMQRVVGRLHSVADRVVGLAPAESEAILRDIEEGILRQLHMLSNEPSTA